jgi:hypothetical protein
LAWVGRAGIAVGVKVVGIPVLVGFFVATGFVAVGFGTVGTVVGCPLITRVTGITMRVRIICSRGVGVNVETRINVSLRMGVKGRFSSLKSLPETTAETDLLTPRTRNPITTITSTIARRLARLLIVFLSSSFFRYGTGHLRSSVCRWVGYVGKLDAKPERSNSIC